MLPDDGLRLSPSVASADKGRRAAETVTPCAEDECHGRPGDVWLFPIKLNTHLPYSPAPLLDGHPLGEMTTCVCPFIVALFILAENETKARCPSSGA